MVKLDIYIYIYTHTHVYVYTYVYIYVYMGSLGTLLVAQTVKNLPAMQKTRF